MGDKQKFTKGDCVRVAKDLGVTMSHFTNDCDAVVLYSYDDKFGGGNTKSYGIHIKDHGTHSWYYENQLELIEPNRLDLLEQWETERQAEIDLKSDLDWIFDNGKEVLKNPHGASVQALASCLGAGDLWGSRGEGITYYTNSIRTLYAAEPFLLEGSKEKWLEACKPEEDK